MREPLMFRTCCHLLPNSGSKKVVRISIFHRESCGFILATKSLRSSINKEGTLRFSTFNSGRNIENNGKYPGKMELKLNLIAAASENRGIGINGRLPWNLRSEMNFFTTMTSKTQDEDKKNVVLMGRRTWECIPKKYRPLKDRINIVLSSQELNLGDEALLCESIPSTLNLISNSLLREKVESIWVIGGSNVYREAMESPNFYRLYLTEVKREFECDAFFPQLPDDLVLVQDENVPVGIQEEGGLQFEYKVYEKKNKNIS